jgi:hypothetical protein
MQREYGDEVQEAFLAVAPFHNLTECEAFKRLNLSGLYMHRVQYYALPIRLEQPIPYPPKGPVL